MIKRALARAAHPFRLAVNYLWVFDFGFALRRYPSQHGRPVPWFSSSCVRWLVTLHLDGKRVMEYGGGNSTVWFAQSGATVECFERDKEWQARITEMAGPSATNIRFVDKFEDTDYDLAVVDVHNRIDHLQDALSRVTPDGIVIFDDSNWYPRLFGSLNGYLSFHFWGWSAGFHGLKCTTVIVPNGSFTQHSNDWPTKAVSKDDKPLPNRPLISETDRSGHRGNTGTRAAIR